MKQGIVTLILIGILLPGFSLAQEDFQAPEGLEQVQELGEKALDVTKKELPGIIQRVWENEVMPVWQKMYQAWLGFWDRNIKSWINSLWQERKDLIEQEFEKEKEQITEELKTEGSKVGQSLWEKFKNIIK